MKYFNEHPLLFRVLFLTIAFFLLALAGMSLHHSASFQTDENFFSTSPSRLYVTKSAHAQMLKARGDEEEAITAFDSVLVGDLILTLNGSEYDSLAQVHRFLTTLAPTAFVDLYIVRPKANLKMFFRLRASTLSENYLREIPASVYITAVFEDGASDRAGMLVGDLVLRINNRDFRNQNEADDIMRRAEADRAIAYEVLRNNRMLTLHVTLARFGASLATFLGILGGLSFWGLAVFIGGSRPQFHAARLLALA
ncbi:MAG: PDZ domain-containing protein, partial [candidate division KSB1 bacterium]